MGRAYIVFPADENRSTLQLFVDRVKRIDDVQSVSSLHEAKKRLKESTPIDFLFVSNSFGLEEIAYFIECAKKSPASQKSAVILVCQTQEQTFAAVANLMVVGIHSFLSEPFSLESVEEAIELAASVRLQSSSTRMKAAAGITLAEILNSREGSDQKLRSSEDKEVNAVWNQYKRITGDSLSHLVVADLATLSPTKRLPQAEEHSRKVKSVFEAKLRENLQIMKTMMRRKTG